jgi:hypothetical protein
MGLVYYGIHEKIALAMCNKYKLRTLVETGTWKGNSAEWAAEIFEKVITIEIIEEYYQQSKERLAKYDNVTCLHGDSREILPSLVEELTVPTLWWLDAHWTGHKDYKKEYGENNAIIEVNAINEFKHPHVIMVDDYFQFPAVTGIKKGAIIDALLNNDQRKVIIEDDIFYTEPKT